MKRQVKCTIVEDIDKTKSRIPGAIQYALDGRGLFYICPCGCGKEGYLAFEGKQKVQGYARRYDGPTWEWDGNKESPTLSPSILHEQKCVDDVKVHWQGWLRGGVFEDC
jgi:hypothetical protein